MTAVGHAKLLQQSKINSERDGFMAAPRAQQVIQEQVLIRPVRYEGYHKDLIAILNDALRAVGDGTGTTKRRGEIAEAIRAKASQVPSKGEDE